MKVTVRDNITGEEQVFHAEKVAVAYERDGVDFAPVLVLGLVGADGKDNQKT